MQGAPGSARGNARQGTASVYNPPDSSNKMGRMLMQKFNPFNKRQTESLAVEYGGTRKKATEERKQASGIYPRSHRGIASPHKVSRDPGESFLDLYSEAEFADLDTPEIISRLNKNLRSFRSFHDKASKQADELRELQTKKQNESKGGEMTPEEREINEELDKRMTQIYELELKIKSLEQLISKLEEERNLEQEVARKNQELRETEAELQRKDDELANERKAKQELIDNIKEDLTEQINEV